MGEFIYNYLKQVFATPCNTIMDAPDIAAMAFADIIAIFSFISIASILIWFTTKSILIRRSKIVYLLAAIMLLCALNNLGHIITYPTDFRILIEATRAILAFWMAIFIFQKRHSLLGSVYQFKYVVGLIKTLEKLEEVEGTGDEK